MHASRATNRANKSAPPVAVKEIVTDEKALKSHSEMILLLELDKHEHIVSLLAAYIYGRHVWLVLELYTGGTAFDFFVNREENAEEPEIRDVMSGLLRGISYCHTYVHPQCSSLCSAPHNLTATRNACSLVTTHGPVYMPLAFIHPSDPSATCPTVARR